MTADLIERLNALERFLARNYTYNHAGIAKEAADEMARLRGERDMYRDTLAELCGEMVVCEAERDELRKALEEIVADNVGDKRAIAARALTRQKEAE